MSTREVESLERSVHSDGSCERDVDQRFMINDQPRWCTILSLSPMRQQYYLSSMSLTSPNFLCSASFPSLSTDRGIRESYVYDNKRHEGELRVLRPSIPSNWSKMPQPSNCSMSPDLPDPRRPLNAWKLHRAMATNATLNRVCGPVAPSPR